MMKYLFTKPRFRLKFPGLVDKLNCECCIYYIKGKQRVLRKPLMYNSTLGSNLCFQLNM